MANLFGKNKLHEIAAAIDTESVKDYIAIVADWHKDYHNGSLKKDKETSREQEYNHAFFKSILGYKEKPATPFSFEPKATTDMGQLPDAVIGYTDSAIGIRNIAAVVELKGAGIDLDRPQRRDGNMSPVQQGFKYKTQYRSVPFVIVSNFWEFRLYHDNLLDYEVWTLDDLVNPEDDYILFKTWFALLKKDSLTTAKGVSKTETLLSDIRIEQENIGKKFYKVYKEARLNLLRDIYSQNDHIKTDIDTGIQKAQKIIDRVVFAAFAEDRGLLPDNTLQRVIKAADSSVYGGSLWNTLKGFFEAIDVGSDKLEIPNGYNGGLFKHDEVLNNLRISDEPLRKVVELGTYNYAEDLSVNILGHIFEQSISDLEEIKNKVNEIQSLEAISQNRRKKDGIFYTPDYIVRYIVDNSLGAYLREHEEKFKAEFGLKGDILDKTYEKRERQAYTKYQDFLQNVKVVDPACGSGAFLVYVFDYLLAENKRVGDILGMSLFSTDEYVRDILRNNIYGVDLNEESVEITKLSLWLKTAQKGKKLTTLDNNIRCGNSLVDDPDVAGEKVFNWQDEFADVIKNGGFDVVVGNPPYVATKQIPKNDRDYYWNRFAEILFSEMDLYEIFTYKMLREVVKDDGFLGFITPNSYYTNTSFQHYRRYLLENTQIKFIVDFPYRFFPFSDVNTETAILILHKKSPRSNSVGLWSIDKNEILQSKTIGLGSLKVATKARQSDIVSLYDGKIILNQNPVVTKMLSTKTKFGDRLVLHKGWMSIPETTTYQGQTFDTGKFSKEEVRQYGLQDICKPYLEGRDIHRYYFDEVEKFVNASGMDTKTEGWHFQEKIILQRIVGQNKNKIFATLDSSNYIIFPNANLLNCVENESPKIYLSILNSTLISYFYNQYFGESNTNLTKSALEGMPLPVIDSSHKDSLQKLTDKMLDNTSALHKKSEQFQDILRTEFIFDKWATKLKKWWRLDFAEFVKALKVNLSLAQRDELLQLFEKYRLELSSLDSEITETEREIDQLVYRLYGLTPEEIAIVEVGVNGNNN
jgi:type I restriction-modification system DNA methylase subunit